jgi:hypothetical protein
MEVRHYFQVAEKVEQTVSNKIIQKT